MKIFVYGSLRRGMHNDIHRFFERTEAEAEYLGTTVVKGKMYSLGAFPYITEPFPYDRQGEVVLGEVYEIKSSRVKLLKALDRLEGYPSFYNRKMVSTALGEVWVYFIPNRTEVSPQVPNGDWVSYVNRTGATNES